MGKMRSPRENRETGLAGGVRWAVLAAVALLTAFCLLTPYLGTMPASGANSWSYYRLAPHLNVLRWPSAPSEILNFVVLVPLAFAVSAFFFRPPFSRKARTFFLLLGLLGLLGWAYTSFEMSFVLFAVRAKFLAAYYIEILMTGVISLWSALLAFPAAAKIPLFNFLFRG